MSVVSALRFLWLSYLPRPRFQPIPNAEEPILGLQTALTDTPYSSPVEDPEPLTA